ncbi:IucA/IucC family protein, partial [Bacillus solimangrovi]
KEGWEGDQEAIDVFKHDLTNSSANLTFAYAHYENKQQNFMFNELTSHSHAYAFTEQSVIEGHPCHPGAKLKKGLSPSENYQYSAEFQNSIHLAFIAIHHSLVSVATLNNDWNKMLFSYEPSLKATFQETLIKHNKQTEDYFILPIHPWQMEKVIPTMYAAELDKFLLIDVPYNNSAYYAGMSFRTLFPKVIEGLKPHYKLTTNVHLTGEVRTLSEQTIHNGPLMSEILTSITKTDLLINERTFIPIVELGGLHFLKESDNEPLRTERSENLACVIRENLYHYIEENEIPIVGSALLSTNTTNESTLLVQLICQYKQTYEIDCLKDAVHSFLQKYVQNIISGVIPLLVKYGIGLEGHLQNTVPVFHQDGTPTKILIRDWEGIRVDKERLSKAGFDLTKFHAKSRILTDSLKSVRNKVFYSVVQNHIGELILQLTKELRDIDEQFLWNIVKKQIDMTFENLQHNGADVQSINEDRNIFFNKEIDYKAVTTMRMLGEAHEYSYVKVSNPLSN